MSGVWKLPSETKLQSQDSVNKFETFQTGLVQSKDKKNMCQIIYNNILKLKNKGWYECSRAIRFKMDWWLDRFLNCQDTIIFLFLFYLLNLCI